MVLQVWFLATPYLYLIVAAAGSSRLRSTVAAESEGIKIPLERSAEGFYTATLQVASQSARLLVDSGSGDIWIPVIDQSRSSFAALAAHLAPGRPFHVKYGSSTASGTVQRGSVSFPDGLEAMCEYGLATHEDGQLQGLSSVDGIWGLSIGGSVENLVHCLWRQHRIPGKVLTLTLRPDGGSMELGAAPSGLHNFPIVGNGSAWSVPLHGVSVHWNEKRSEKRAVIQDTEVALLDTGNRGIRAPASAMSKLAYDLTAEEHDGGYRVPCKKGLPIPDLIFDLGSEDGTFSVVLSSSHLLGDSDENGWCPLKIHPSGSDQWILGDVFFQRMSAVVLDYQRKTVGLQTLPDGSRPESPSLKPAVGTAAVAWEPPALEDEWQSVKDSVGVEATKLGIRLTTPTPRKVATHSDSTFKHKPLTTCVGEKRWWTHKNGGSRHCFKLLLGGRRATGR